MAGFAARKQASQGTAQPLHAKALAIDDGGGRRAVLVTADLLGVTAEMSARIVAAVARRHRVPRERLLINASHTHCGPVVDGMLSVAYDLDAAQVGAIRAYTRELEGTDRGPSSATRCRAWRRRSCRRSGRGAVRRQSAGAVHARTGRSITASPCCAWRRTHGLVAIVFGYACHNTTLQPDFVRFHGDYAGVAQAALERRHPGRDRAVRGRLRRRREPDASRDARAGRAARPGARRRGRSRARRLRAGARAAARGVPGGRSAVRAASRMRRGGGRA